MPLRRIFLLAILALALGAQPTAAAPVSSHASVYTCCMPFALKERLFAESKAMGAAYIRVDVEMSAIWGSRSASADWRGLDQVMLLSRRYRLPVFAIVLGTPAWLGPCDRCPPRDPAEFGRLAGEVAAHSRGVIDRFEILNEPDEGWAFRGSAQDYARILSASYDAIKRRAPGAQVALGGIGWLASRPWLARVFATPGAAAARKFDIANVHLRGTVGSLPGQVAQWRAFLRTYRFAGPLWVTEHGYPSDGRYQRDPGFLGGEAAQVAYLRGSLLALADAGVGQVFVTLRDSMEGVWASEGVVHVGGSAPYGVRRKPAFAAVRAFVDRWPYIPGWRAAQQHLQAASKLSTFLAAGFQQRADKTRRRLRRARRLLAARRRCAAHAKRSASRGCARRARATRKRVRRLRVRWRRDRAAAARCRREARAAGLGALRYARLVAGG